MNKDTKIKQLFVVVFSCVLFTVVLSGCTDNNRVNNEIDLSKFLGTWVGNMEQTQIINFRDNGSMRDMDVFGENRTFGNITALEFDIYTLYITITTENETQTVSYSYTVEDDQLDLSFQFTDGGERPRWGPNFNDSELPPFDGDRPFDGERPFNGERPTMTISFIYSFNENYNVLYLNGSPFTKK